MEGGSVGVGMMAVFAVSGSIVFIAREVHKRLLSDFMKKIEYEFGGNGKGQVMKKKVRFADDVIEPSTNSKEYRKRIHHIHMHTNMEIQGKTLEDHHRYHHHHDHDHDHHHHHHHHQALDEMDEYSMPINRQVLYKGILQYKSLKTHHVSNFR